MVPPPPREDKLFGLFVSLRMEYPEGAGRTKTGD
jgi:hypothetical protein